MLTSWQSISLRDYHCFGSMFQFDVPKVYDIVVPVSKYDISLDTLEPAVQYTKPLGGNNKSSSTLGEKGHYSERQ